MPSSFTIGEFSQATLLSVKTLRYYHATDLLEPAEIDPSNGRRRYRPAQIATAQIIRRFRSLDMPIDEIRAVLTAPDPASRDAVIAAHLDRLEATLERTNATIGSLRDLLQSYHPGSEVVIEHRLVEATQAAAIHSIVELRDLALWFEGAFGEIYATLAAQSIPPAGLGGGVYANGLFTVERGEATVFVPCRSHFRPSGRVEPVVVPPAELAIATHAGHHDEADRTYGALATHVAEHALGVDGPIREYYLIGRRDTSDSAKWRTEIGWPIFHIGTTPALDPSG